MSSPLVWRCRGRRYELSDRPLVLGIVNVTPDSFSDGGRTPDAGSAVARGLALAADGADMLDVGGESTRPGADPVPPDDELRRVIPVVRGLAAAGLAVSTDTRKSAVARAALDAGACVVNDVGGLSDPDMVAACRDAAAGVIVMHMRGDPRTMQAKPEYADVTREVGEFLGDRLAAAADAGVDPEQVCVDPGVGFGKTAAHNLELIAGLRELWFLNRPVCLGVSRKGFIGKVCGREVGDRLAGSLAVACYAMAERQAHVLRVHDVAATRDAVLMFDAIRKASDAHLNRIRSST